MLGDLTKLNLKSSAVAVVLAALFAAGVLFVSACIVIETGPDEPAVTPSPVVTSPTTPTPVAPTRPTTTTGEPNYSVSDFEIRGYGEHILSSIRLEGIDPDSLTSSEAEIARGYALGRVDLVITVLSSATDAQWLIERHLATANMPGLIPYDVYVNGTYIGSSSDVLTRLSRTSAINLSNALYDEINRFFDSFR